ncbi:MAG TPA: exopolysaccharide Pel transporter PelG [Rickettsiales bacterium]|nr:exopolysaccharide Pel transporter PelG [Rickettsiales bacterium]
MAGIGFALKRLTSKDDLLGIGRAYVHATMASTGPWLFTVLSLGAISLLYLNYFTVNQLIDFRIVVVYNFGFSLVLSAPVYMVVTRYLADHIHKKDVTHVPTVVLHSLILLYFILIPLAFFYYGFYTDMELSMRLSAIANLFLISPIWLLGVYMTALKDYKSITRAFGVGMALAVVFSYWFKDKYGAVGMLNGYNIGIAWIAFALLGKIFAEYPYILTKETDLRKYFGKYWELAVGGVLYNAAIWADKWLMWMYAPEAVTLPSKMTYYPNYDSAMFLSYLTIVPAMAIFIFSIETSFFTRYQRFYYDILEHKPLSVVRKNHREIVANLLSSARNFFIVQGAISLIAILTASKLFEVFNVNYLQIGIFRLGTLGAFFHVLMLFELIALSYFDCRKITMWIQGLYLVLNSVFTLVSIHMGFQYYGYGYFASSMVIFLITTFVLFDHLRKLPYHAFITTNNSLRAHH